uniref:F-box domain-containing protein n=1 Tax=Oryza barthii TaxID=65489 RepID=A0A0D3GX73_9ORYZ
MDAMPVPEQLSPETRDWSDLPVDALFVVFAKLRSVELLMGAGLVCSSWLQAAKLPHLWRCVDMSHQRDESRRKNGVLCAMAKVAVDRSGGKLEVYKGRRFVTNNLLAYVANRSPSLKCLYLESCTRVSNKGLTELITKCPLLEDLKLYNCRKIDGDFFVVAGKACRRMKRLDVRWRGGAYLAHFDCDGDEPFEIATMRELRHQTLACLGVSKEELMAIVDGCPQLELLHVSGLPGLATAVDDDDDDALRALCYGIKSLTLRPYQEQEVTTWVDYYYYSDMESWE